MHVETAENELTSELKLKLEQLLVRLGKLPSDRTDKDIALLVHEFENHLTNLEIKENQLFRKLLETDADHFKYRKFFEYAPSGFVIMDINNFIIELNRKAAGLLGGTQKELINARFSSFIKKEHQMVFHEIKKLARTELSAKTFEIEIQRENDRPFWVNITLEPLRHKSKASAGSFMTLTDISELKKKRRVSSEVNARIERISDFLPFLICLTNSRGECIYFNNSWLDFTGKTFEHEYGKGWMNQIHRKDIGAFMNYFRNMLKKQSMMEGVLRLKHHTGSYRETLFRFIPEFSFDNTFKGYIGCFTPAMERSGKAPPMFKGVA